MGCVKSRLCGDSLMYSPIHISKYVTRKDTLWELYLENKMTDWDKDRAAEVCQELQSTLDRISGYRRIAVVVGSCCSGIGLHGADVDITIVPSVLEVEIMDSVVSAIQSDQNSQFELVAYLDRARVPIIKLVHSSTGSDVDISWNRPENETMAHLLRVYAALSPLVKPLIVLLKYWARSRRLFDPPRGFLGGFQISLMLIFHQQQRNGLPALSSDTRTDADAVIPRKNVEISEDALEFQFQDFFKFYSEFDFINVIDIRNRRRINKRFELPDNNGHWWTPMAIVHPITGPAGGNHGACVRPGPWNSIRSAFVEMASFEGDFLDCFVAKDYVALPVF